MNLLSLIPRFRNLYRRLRPLITQSWAAALVATALAAAGVSAADQLPAEEQVVRPQSAVTEAIVSLGNMSSARADYEMAVIETALEKGRARYGDYTLYIDSSVLTNDRLERNFRSGESANIVSHPVWNSNLSEDSTMRVIPIPIAEGLLGYRQLVVQKADLPKFREVATLADLQKFTAGMGRDWVDHQVLERAGLRWFGGNSIQQLLSMLARGRFDYVPLGSLEVEEVIAASDHHAQLAVVPNLIVYYPLPIYVQVSTSKPLLAERVEYGLRRMIEDGSLQALFEKHHGGTVKKLQSQSPRIITLENPHLPDFAVDKGPVLVKQRP